MTYPSALLSRDLKLETGERELAEPTSGQARVRVEWAGICGSDLHVLRNGSWVSYWPATLGHEVAGVVDAIEPGLGFEPGSPVVLDSRLPCLDCFDCAENPDNCHRVTFLGESIPGGFASHCVVPVRSLHAVPPGLELEDAVLAEPLAVALHALGGVRDDPGRTLILGHGPVGALMQIELRRRFENPDIDVIEPVELRAKLARALGATLLDSPNSGKDYNLVIDAAGYDGSIRDAVGAANFGGTILLLAISEVPSQVTSRDLVEKSVVLRGSNGFVDELPVAISLLAEQAHLYRPLVTNVVPLSQLPEMARRQLDSPDEIKVLVKP